MGTEPGQLEVAVTEVRRVLQANQHPISPEELKGTNDLVDRKIDAVTLGLDEIPERGARLAAESDDCRGAQGENPTEV